MAKLKGAWNAVLAVLIVSIVSAILAVALYKTLGGFDPCHTVNTLVVASPEGAFVARKTELSCKQPNATQHLVRIAVSERNNKTGKSRQFGNVFVCSGVTASELSIEWTGSRQLSIEYPEDRVGPAEISAQEPHFKDVTIIYKNKDQQKEKAAP